MTEVQASTQLAGSTKLWRYLSLDKLIDLLLTSELFFTPLAAFARTDPFEGCLPSVAFEADASMVRQVVNDVGTAYGLLAEHRKAQGCPLTIAEQETVQASLNDLKSVPRHLRLAMAKATVVNCWHAGESESEAMWRLYSENGKAIAIETTLDGLKESIQSRESASVVRIYPVKYLDFFDSTIRPIDCVIEGHRAPLLKRISYQHEREVRAFIWKIAPNPRAAIDIDFWKPEPMRLPIDVRTLIKAIHVSPYCEEPFPRSVAAVCEAFGIGSAIVQPSRLLSGYEELLDRLLL
jgi:hypothetical protein